MKITSIFNNILWIALASILLANCDNENGSNIQNTDNFADCNTSDQKSVQRGEEDISDGNKSILVDRGEGDVGDGNDSIVADRGDGDVGDGNDSIVADRGDGDVGDGTPIFGLASSNANSATKQPTIGEVYKEDTAAETNSQQGACL